MIKSDTWSVTNVRLARFVPWAVVTATIAFGSVPETAYAAGTAAGTTISNVSNIGGNLWVMNEYDCMITSSCVRYSE